MRRALSLTLMSACLLLAAAAQAQLIRFGGGTLPHPNGDCISPAERTRVQTNIAFYHALHGGPPLDILTSPAPYPFVPQGGNLFDDLFVNNYVDLDSSAGILDWDSTDWTYDGHRGHDIDLRTFTEQEIGVPIFAALDGTVVDAHDGEFDHNTVPGGNANYVILWHGGSHYAYYWHMRLGSVAVTIGQQVRAGKQIGMTASSGYSTGPHLHFESWYANAWYEPSAGFSRPGESNWVNQIPIRRDTYFRDFNLTDIDISTVPGLPYDRRRTGTFLLGTQRIAWWINLMNFNPGSNWRVRILRPNGTVRFDSATVNFNQNAYYRWSWWYWVYGINFDVTGNWQVEMRINGQTIARAPFRVVSSANQIVNRAPNSAPAEFDPPDPLTEDVLFCRVHPALSDDPDYDVVRYRYRWKVAGRLVRDVTTAGNADALPAGTAQSGDLVECTVTPTDGVAFGASTRVQTFTLGSRRVQVAGVIGLEECVNIAGQTVTLDFRPNSAAPGFSRVVTLGSGGTFSVDNIPDVSYRVGVKGSKWLRSTASLDASGDDVADFSAELRAGDANGDNSVDALDLAVLISAFNATPSDASWDWSADLNADDAVDALDLSLLITNFNATGD